MRYLSKNADGSVALWATVPLALRRDSDGAVFTVKGIRRRGGRCWLYGGYATGQGGEFDVGNEAFDVSDMTSLSGFTIVWPDFDTDIKAKLPPAIQANVIASRTIRKADIPDDRDFRNAWVDTGKIDVDMPKAREIHRDRLRAEREPLLAALDVDYIKADEMGDAVEKARIAAKKQVLRDITDDPRIEAAKTPADLKAVKLP